MAVVWIDQPADPPLAGFASVGDAALLREHGLFVAEGRLVVERLLRQSRYRVRSILLSEPAWRAFAEQAPEVLNLVGDDVPVFVCRVEQLRGITGYDFHRGCLAIAERPAPLAPAAILQGHRLVVVIEGVTNADNVGGMFRNAAAFGAGAVLLSPSCCDPLYRKAVRTSMAATLQVPFARVEPWPAGLDVLRAAGYSIVALTPRPPSILLDAFAEAPPPRIALLLGTEGAGLTAALESAADVRVRIPTTAAVDSLNVAVACGVALSRLSRSERLSS